MKKLLILLVIPFPVEAASIVIATDQDYDIAKAVAENLSADLLIVKYGECQSISGFDKVIVIGGEDAVPYKGVHERIGGINRIETARMVMKTFFAVDIRSEERIEINKKIKFYIGNSSVAERWGKYYASKIRRLEKNAQGDAIAVVGNKNNNEVLNKLWNITNLPPEASLLPLVYLKDDVLFLTGSDQNIFYNQKVFEKSKRSYELREIFFPLLIILVLLKFEKRVSAIVLAFFILQLYFIPKKGELAWDALTVYFDGALSLFFQGKYETIMSERVLPGTSFITYLYFIPTCASDLSANLMISLFSVFILLSSYTISSKMYGKNAGFVVLLLLATNPTFHQYSFLYSSDIPLTAFTLASVLFKNPTISGIFLGIALLIRPSAILLLFPMLLKKPKVLISIPIFISGICLAGEISGYFSEIEVKAHAISAYSFQYLKDFFKVTNYFMAPLLLLGLRSGMFSQYIMLHMLFLCLWVTYDIRYLVPILPFAIMLQGKKFENRYLILLVPALILNFIKLVEFYF